MTGPPGNTCGAADSPRVADQPADLRKLAGGRPNIPAYHKGVLWRRNVASRQPGVSETVGGRGALGRVKRQHRQQEVGELARLLLGPLVLLHQDLVQRPRLQLGDVAQLACGTVSGAQGWRATGWEIQFT